MGTSRRERGGLWEIHRGPCLPGGWLQRLRLQLGVSVVDLRAGYSLALSASSLSLPIGRVLTILDSVNIRDMKLPHWDAAGDEVSVGWSAPWWERGGVRSGLNDWGERNTYRLRRFTYEYYDKLPCFDTPTHYACISLSCYVSYLWAEYDSRLGHLFNEHYVDNFKLMY